MNQNQPEPASALIEEIHRKLGRNLLRFQRMEVQLKAILPYIHPDGGAKGADGLRTFRTAIARKTLGELFKDFGGSIQTPTPELLEAQFQKIRDARNQIVHHFFRLPGIDLMTVEGGRAAIDFLNRQYEESNWLSELIRDMSAALLNLILDDPQFQTPEFAGYREQLERQIGPNTEIIHNSDPTRTRWATTRIVELLRLAERETEPEKGMTLLSRAGAFIRKQAPDLSPKTYGLKKLMDVLLVSDLFEVEFKESESGGGVTVLYRSK